MWLLNKDLKIANQVGNPAYGETTYPKEVTAIKLLFHNVDPYLKTLYATMQLCTNSGETVRGLNGSDISISKDSTMVSGKVVEGAGNVYDEIFPKITAKGSAILSDIIIEGVKLSELITLNSK